MSTASGSEWDWRMQSDLPFPNGKCGSNTGDWTTLVNTLYFATQNANGYDERAILAAIKVNDTIRVAKATNSTIYSKWKVIAAPIDETTYFSIPVSYVESAGVASTFTCSAIFAGATPTLTVAEHLLNICVLGGGLIITPQSPPATLGPDAIVAYRSICEAYMADPDLPK